MRTEMLICKPLIMTPRIRSIIFTLPLLRNPNFNTLRPLPMPPSSSNIVAEYAKSKRSTCKGCNQSIPEKALRFGLTISDPRGFASTKWHHLDCFSFEFDSAESIKGFDSLKSVDQEALKKLMEDAGRKDKGKVKQRSVDGEDGAEENETKRQKLSVASEEAKVEIPDSISGIKDKYKDATLMPNWKAFETIIFLERDEGLQDSSKIAAFDFDGCLAKTSVNRTGSDAWSLMYPSIPDKLEKLYHDGYKLVIFTNESNIERWKNKRQVAVDSKALEFKISCSHYKMFFPWPLPGKRILNCWTLVDQVLLRW